MDWQSLIVICIGIVALLYVGRIFKRQFKKADSNPECNNCPVIDKEV